MSVSINIAGGTVHLSGNPIKVTLTASEAKTNHKLLLKVQFDEQFGGPQTDAIIPVNLVSEFDISGLVDNPVEYLLDYYPVGKFMWYPALAFVVEIFYGESWIDEEGEPQTAWEDENSVIRVLKGKLPQYQLALLNDDNTNFNEEFIQKGKFLTFMPNNQMVGPNQLAKLYYLSRWTENHDATLHFRALCSDGNTLSEDEDLTMSGGYLLEFSLSPLHIGTIPPEGVLVLQYTFWLSDASGDISERRTFVVDNEYHDKAWVFYYINPLSGGDSLWITGAFSEKLKTESETSYKPLLPGAGTQQASMITTNSSQQRAWEINTGIKSRDEMLAMRWFLSAKERWMVNPDDSQKLIPIYVEGGETLLDETDWDDKNIELKILEAHR